MSSSKRLLYVIGLRNFDPKFTSTRHNIGADALQHFAAARSLSWHNKGFADVSDSSNDDLVLALPRTFMNLSGKPVAQLVQRQFAAQDLIVIHDELELELGKVKVKSGGSARGHNGLKSIIQSLAGFDGFTRIMVGIGRPASRKPEDVARYVLDRFNSTEREKLYLAYDLTSDLIEKLRTERAAKILAPKG